MKEGNNNYVLLLRSCVPLISSINNRDQIGKNLLPEDGDRSSLRNIVFCPFLDKIGTMDIVQNLSFN
jgi:hypothetical protein